MSLNVLDTNDNAYLYHVYHYLTQGPFSTFQLPKEHLRDWTGLKFSSDGKMILIYSNGNYIRLLDSFQGEVLRNFSVRINFTVLYYIIKFFIS